MGVFWVGVAEHGDFIAKSILVVACPGKRGVDLSTSAWLFILGPPPAAIDGIHQSGTGKSHRAITISLNAVFDHNAKVMVGAEYETFEGTVTDVEATTLWAAFRMYF